MQGKGGVWIFWVGRSGDGKQRVTQPHQEGVCASRSDTASSPGTCSGKNCLEIPRASSASRLL
jgi:hypothetical protein